MLLACTSFQQVDGTGRICSGCVKVLRWMFSCLATSRPFIESNWTRLRIKCGLTYWLPRFWPCFRIISPFCFALPVSIVSRTFFFCFPFSMDRPVSRPLSPAANQGRAARATPEKKKNPSAKIEQTGLLIEAYVGQVDVKLARNIFSSGSHFLFGFPKGRQLLQRRSFHWPSRPLSESSVTCFLALPWQRGGSSS